MRTILVLLTFTCLTFGQDRDRVFYLTHSPTIQQFQEVATVIRTMTDIREAKLDNEQKSVTLHASVAQVALAEWLFNELDNPAVQPAVLHEYRVPSATDDVVRLFYLTQTPSVQDFQEVATVVRTFVGFTRAFTYNEARAYVVRGTAAQIGLAEWLLKRLDPTANSSSSEYRMSGTNDDVIQVLYLTGTPNVQDFQKAATTIREATKIQRVFTYSAPRAVALRGTADQIATAERMAKQFEKP